MERAVLDGGDDLLDLAVLHKIRLDHRRWHHGFDHVTNLVNLPLR